MTQEQQDAAWRALPGDFKRQLRCDYTTAESAHSLDPTNVRIEIHKHYLEMYFGKHNLTATEEEKPMFDLGSKAIVCNGFNRDNIKDGDIVTLFGYDCVLGGYYAVLNSIIGTIIPDKYLTPYSDEQEPKNSERVDFSSSSSQNRKNLTENEIPSMSKETAEDLSNLMAEVNNFIERNQDSQVDWLAYRMELAKEVATALIVKGHNIAFVPESTSLIVDGIVERLKGGEK